MLRPSVRKLKRHISIGLLLFTFLTACKKDGTVLLNDGHTIDNTLIAGGSTTSFQRIIGGHEMDVFNSVKQTVDGGFIFCGLTENESASEMDILLYKTNSAGETLWYKLLSDTYSGQGLFIEITNDNGFIIAAFSSLFSTFQQGTNYVGQLIKTDSIGNLIWSQSFTFGDFTSFSTVKQTSDGGYIVCGSELETDKGFLLKTDASGNEIWRKIFGGLVGLSSIDITNDGGFILCGYIKTTTAAPADIYIIKTNSSGDTLWTKTYGDDSDNYGSTIKETSSGAFILCGYNTNPNESGYAKLIDANGAEIWHTDLLSNGVQRLANISITNDNQFIAIGTQFIGSSPDSYLIKIDGNGNKVWQKTFNLGYNNSLCEVQQTSDNGYVIAGYLHSDLYPNALIIKTDSNGD